uniref:Uncharacterized protein n=1 Tax=Laticauda laticaudata TaxID=8630 RepID=A0A8C5SKD3_LATLA
MHRAHRGRKTGNKDTPPFPSQQPITAQIASRRDQLSSTNQPQFFVLASLLQLAIQIDEIEGLKNALQESIRTKEEDFQVYQDTVGQVKEIFLHALKQHTQEKN